MLICECTVEVTYIFASIPMFTMNLTEFSKTNFLCKVTLKMLLKDKKKENLIKQVLELKDMNGVSPLSICSPRF